jgi:PASTA domain-containing protein
MAIPALLLGLLALALVGRSGIGVASSGAGTLAPKPATTSVVPLGEATTLPQPPQVRVPDVEGRPLAEAWQLFAEVGLPASAHDPDPAVPGSVVVSQEPPGGTMVPGGSPVGLRTALVTPALCAALAGVPDTDQTFFPASPGLLARLDATAVVAPPTLRSFIRTLLSWLRAHPAATSVSLHPGSAARWIASSSTAAHVRVPEAATERPGPPPPASLVRKRERRQSRMWTVMQDAGFGAPVPPPFGGKAERWRQGRSPPRSCGLHPGTG